MIQTGKILSVIFNNDNYEDKVELNLGDYEVKEEDGKWFAVRKKKEYPKTYEECCKVGVYDDYYDDTGYRGQLFLVFTKLIVARDVYWKIAGEEMGLGKPWEPDWENVKSRKYAIVAGERGKIVKGDTTSYACAFAFPTEEMRDAFYENFKELIESCKELL